MTATAARVYDAEGFLLNKNGQRNKTQKHPNVSKKSSKDLTDPKTRSELEGGQRDPEARKPRVHRGAGKALDLSAAVLADIKAKNCVSRWVLDQDARLQAGGSCRPP